jgi:cobalt-zinc-cadmium efflux system protein
VLSALAQSALLFGVGLFALVEGIRRLFEPPEIASGSLLLFGIIGLAANVIAMAVLFSGRGRNLNMRAAFLEVLNDALGSLAVIVAAIVIATTGYERADAIVSILIAVMILPRTITLLWRPRSVIEDDACSILMPQNSPPECVPSGFVASFSCPCGVS